MFFFLSFFFRAVNKKNHKPKSYFFIGLILSNSFIFLFWILMEFLHWKWAIFGSGYFSNRLTRPSIFFNVLLPWMIFMFDGFFFVFYNSLSGFWQEHSFNGKIIFDKQKSLLFSTNNWNSNIFFLKETISNLDIFFEQVHSVQI